MTPKIILAYLTGALLASGIWGIVMFHSFPVVASFVLMTVLGALTTIIVSLVWIIDNWNEE